MNRYINTIKEQLNKQGQTIEQLLQAIWPNNIGRHARSCVGGSYVLSSVIRWFYITNVGVSSMTGTQKVWDETSSQWITHNITDADIYPQPGTQISDYSAGSYYPCVFVGGRWFAILGGSSGGQSVQYALITQTLEYNDPLKNCYIVERASLVDNVWTKDGNPITITRALGYEGYDSYAQDLRNWQPWYPVNSLVKIISHYDETEADMLYYLDMPMFYTGPETQASLRWNEELGIVQAVWA